MHEHQGMRLSSVQTSAETHDGCVLYSRWVSSWNGIITTAPQSRMQGQSYTISQGQGVDTFLCFWVQYQGEPPHLLTFLLQALLGENFQVSGSSSGLSHI